jgi:predicted DNA-binding transcriptional regulator AlpA
MPANIKDAETAARLHASREDDLPSVVRRVTPHRASKKPPDEEERLIRPKELTHIVGLSISTIKRLIKANRFPPPIHPFEGTIITAWPLSQVRQWVEARVKGKAA